MIPAHPDRVLLWAAVAHLAVGAAALVALAIDSPPVLGVHPALKPLKFGASIAIFLATMAVFLPSLSVDPGIRRAIAWTLSLTMVVEMVPISIQALRGTSSHFNTDGPFNTALWQTMVAAILVATLTMLGVALAATLRPLVSAEGPPMDPISATAWRAGLWLFLLAAISGFGMGGRLRHSVGGEDGGAGLPFVNWSLTHGDLRVSHFFALHALQALPLVGAALAWLPIGSAMRWALLTVAIVLQALVALATLVQAFAARPVW